MKQGYPETVGYTLGRRAGAAEHLKTISRKFGARAGILRHLKKIGIQNDTLVRIYTSLIRLVFEYAAACYHPGLTADQSEQLERLQRISLKVIYGLTTTYQECLRLSGLESLAARRCALFERFVRNSYGYPRFQSRWFTPKTKSIYPLRTEKKVCKLFANCDRLQNAPLYKARKIINEGLCWADI